jgi:hypothetical protein
VTSVQVGDEVIEIPEDASEKVKKALEALKTRLAKEAEAKAADVWGGEKEGTEQDLKDAIHDIFEVHGLAPTLPSVWVQVKLEDGQVSACELFTKYTRIRTSTGPRKARSSNGGGRLSIRDAVRAKYGSVEPEKYTFGSEVFTSPRGILDKLAVPYYKASDPAPTGDAPQRVIVKFGRENPEAAAEIGIVLSDGKTVTLADVVS